MERSKGRKCSRQRRGERMIDNPALVLIIGIIIGILMAMMLGILIYAYVDISKKFRELFKEIRECVKRDK